MPCNKKGQAFRQDLKSGHPNCAIGPAQNEKFIRQHMVNKKNFENVAFHRMPRHPSG